MNSKMKKKESDKPNAEQRAHAQMESHPQSPTLALTPDQSEESTNLGKLLSRHAQLIQHLKGETKLVKDTTCPIMSFKGYHSLQGPLPSLDDLRPEDRVEVADLVSAPNQVFWGKYLLCQTISTAIKDTALEVIVTDPKGTSAMGLALYNYSSGIKSALEGDCDDILPPGSFLVIQNPVFSTEGLMLHSGNPAEVEMVSAKWLETKFPDLGWNGKVAKMTFKFFKKRYFWKNFEDDEVAFAKLKGLGDKGFGEKRFSDAIRFYNMALDYCNRNREDEAMINSNKSAALLALGCYNAALKCADAALEVDPGNEKHNCRKTKALIGLRKYEKGMNFLEQQIAQFPCLAKNKNCKRLLDSVKIMSSRKNLGPTESQLLSFQMKTLRAGDDFPEFIAPVFKISEIEGKGRGLLATEDIAPGQLLIVAKAFGYQATAPINSNPDSYTPFNHGDYSLLLKPSQKAVVGKIANKLAFDPELGPELYNLTGGRGVGYLEPGDCDWRLRVVDLKRIAEIVIFNSFGSTEEDNAEGKGFTGLWTLPSLLNHNCSAHNCMFNICGECITITAISEIKAGEELTLAYEPPTLSYEQRQRHFEAHEFTCDCELCQLEFKEPASIKNEREKILENFGKLSYDCGAEEIKKGLKQFQKLVSFRSENIPLNFPLLSPQVFYFVDILLGKNRLGDAISALNAMFEVAKSSVCWHVEGLNVAVNLMSCHVHRGDKELTKVWMKHAKGLMMRIHGNLESMRISGTSFVELLNEKFGIDFFKDN